MVAAKLETGHFRFASIENTSLRFLIFLIYLIFAFRNTSRMKSRRKFLYVTVAGLAAIFVFLWNKVTLQHLNTSPRKKHVFPLNKNKRVSFDDQFIIVTKDQTRVFSAHCSHLGCKIDQVEGDRLVCPCHGSEYDLDGKVLKGPAYKGLTEKKVQISEDGKTIEIDA